MWPKGHPRGQSRDGDLEYAGFERALRTENGAQSGDVEVGMNLGSRSSRRAARADPLDGIEPCTKPACQRKGFPIPADVQEHDARFFPHEMVVQCRDLDASLHEG